MVRPVNMQDVTFTGLRGKIADFVESRITVNFITLVILINAVTLGLETDDEVVAWIGDTLSIIDTLALSVFVVELILKLFVYRFSFFRQGWNVFDFAIVAISFIPSAGNLSIIRSFRILRVLRLMSVVPQMRRVINALLHAIPGMASIVSVLLIIFYVSAVLTTKLFSGHPVPEIAERFESISASMFTLFQIMTLEGWADDIVRPVMAVYPHSWIFFIPFIIFTSFAVLNLFIGIIVDAINVVKEDAKKGKDVSEPDLGKQLVTASDLHNVVNELSEIKRILSK